MSKTILDCMDLAVGHDWNDPAWSDGPTLRDGRRRVYVTHRAMMCSTCQSIRREALPTSNATA